MYYHVNSKTKVKCMVLVYRGRDSWDRPVYVDQRGRLWKDTNPRKGWQPSLCTALNNKFYGEPDIPMDAMRAYNDARLRFVPERDTW
jgi:hypothetical protein